MAFKVIVIVIELMFLGINMFLALLRAQNDSESGQKHIHARERQLYFGLLYYTRFKINVTAKLIHGNVCGLINSLWHLAR